MFSIEKSSLRRYAFIALIVAGLALLVSAAAGVVIGLVKLQMLTVADVKPWQTAGWISLCLALIGIALFGILDPDRVRRFLTGRQARYGSNSLVFTLAVLTILFMANMLAYQNPQKIDFTEDKTHTLAPETIRALGELPDKVMAVGFYSPRMPTTAASELLQNFKLNSNGRFDFQFIDPDSNPIAAREAGVTGDGKIMLVMGDRKEIASYADETELTRSLIRLISPESRVIYFLTGHGEADIENAGETSLTIARSTLEGKNYTVKTLNLLAENKIPEEALSIVIAGPTKPLASREVDLLSQYVDAGGGLVVMQNPVSMTEFGDAPDPLADYLASEWGIHLENDLIIDLTNSGNELFATSASLSSSSPITQSMTKAAILPQARSLRLDPAPEGRLTTPLAQTTEQSWGETDAESLSGQVSYDEATDIPGPLVLAASGEDTESNGRVVVFGDSPFASDRFFDSYGNGDIFVNSVDWTAEQENLIQITPHQSLERTFNLPSQVQWLMILFGSVLLIPGLVIAAGISNWLTRRARG